MGTDDKPCDDELASRLPCSGSATGLGGGCSSVLVRFVNEESGVASAGVTTSAVKVF